MGWEALLPGLKSVPSFLNNGPGLILALRRPAPPRPPPPLTGCRGSRRWTPGSWGWGAGKQKKGPAVERCCSSGYGSWPGSSCPGCPQASGETSLSAGPGEDLGLPHTAWSSPWSLLHVRFLQVTHLKAQQPPFLSSIPFLLLALPRFPASPLPRPAWTLPPSQRPPAGRRRNWPWGRVQA